MANGIVARSAAPLTVATGGLVVVGQLALWSSLDRTDLVGTTQDPVYQIGGVMYLVAFCLMQLVLFAAFHRSNRGLGVLGLVGVSAASVGTTFLAGDLWFETFAVPWLGRGAPETLSMDKSGLLVVGAFSSYVLFAAGWALLGIAALRGRDVPAAIAVALVIGGLIGFFALVPPMGIPLGLALVWLGVWMARATSGPDGRSAAALARRG